MIAMITKWSVCLTMALAITYARQVPPDVPLAITPVTVIDVTTADSNAALKRNQTVIISGARITAVGPAGRTLVPPGARTIDGGGKFLIPGLWDMHAHVLGDDRLDYFPALFVANGVTGVRDTGSALPPARIREIRTAISAGTTIGPRIGAVAGSILEGAGGRVTPQFMPIANLTEARAAVIAHKESGADFVKVYNRLARDAYLAIVDEARRQRMPVAGHIPMSITAAEASDAGQKSIEHSGGFGSTPAELLMSCARNESTLREEWLAGREYAGPPQKLRAFIEPLYWSIEGRAAAAYDQAKAAALFARFARNSTWHVPTLVLDGPVVLDQTALATNPYLKYMRPAVVQRWRTDQQQRMENSGDVTAWRSRVQRRLRLIGDMHRAGVPMLAGTDANLPYVVPGFSLHDELVLLVNAGLTPLEALRAATINAATFLDSFDSMGTIETGKVADLVLLDANPLSEIRNSKRISAVVTNGRYLGRPALDGLLADAEAIAKREPAR